MPTVLLGVLFLIIAAVLTSASSSHPFWRRFYEIVPTTLLCYFLPSLLTTAKLVDQAAVDTLYGVVSRLLLPCSLVLFTLGVDVRAFRRLGGKAVLMFAASAVSIMLGGPLAVWLLAHVAPSLVDGAGPDAVWRGLATLAGTWIGGGANQTALKEVFQPSDALFSAIVTVDVFVANIWLGTLLYGATRSARIDRWLRADASAVDDVRQRVEQQAKALRRIPTATDLVQLLAVGFGCTAAATAIADPLAAYITTHSPLLTRFSLGTSFFWLVGLATALGVGASFTRLRQLEGAGASSVATVLLYLMIATIGLKMNILAIADQPGLLLVGVIWMAFHVLLMIGFSRLIRAPYFLLAVGSQACIGGPATAPIVAAAFHPALAPVGVLMAILGYAVGTYMGYVCGVLMQLASP
ncbi:hypothetical protein FAES_2762 [Fibrella aestuarina BUZ 2]|uniref:DUF819 family protein n=1 Tax=Fibrella aestuarina BUZ 2 TaxID=1166018 RepID=I0K9G8_9BACT|nr:DUF819 family protein [Fibrella aestuarina]CCH00771.1 hypothetical protein FAES_2762 [Fibrella aestuarina BUZ 2]